LKPGFINEYNDGESKAVTYHHIFHIKGKHGFARDFSETIPCLF